jgi:hypothetical protein
MSLPPFVDDGLRVDLAPDAASSTLWPEAEAP